jgi:hypothetical protein
MAVRIEVACREGVRDIPAGRLKKRIELDLGVCGCTWGVPPKM